jgi:hypothetical protein
VALLYQEYSLGKWGGLEGKYEPAGRNTKSLIFQIFYSLSDTALKPIFYH